MAVQQRELCFRRLEHYLGLQRAADHFVFAERLHFRQYLLADGEQLRPSIQNVGVYGKDVKLSGGATVKADEAYIRESILDPQAKIVAGYEPVMPTFTGLVAVFPEAFTYSSMT